MPDVASIPLGVPLTAEQARRVYSQGEEAVVFYLMQLSALAAHKPASEQPAPSTPSGMIPAYQKPPAPGSKLGRTKRPGAKPGHVGSRRPPPTRIDRRQTHRAEQCPDCGGPLNRCRQRRTRYVEEIPEDVRVEVTEHTVHRDWCPQCRKRVEPTVPDALPGRRLGHRVIVLSAWLHYALGNTLSQVQAVFQHHLQTTITPGGFLAMWFQLQELLYPWYEQIQREALASAVLHADETGWRVQGKTWWLWCFSSPDVTYYMIDRCRGGPALRKFFSEEYDGVLVSDFWGAYNAIAAGARQKCLVHLLRDLKFVEQYKHPGPGWAEFAKKLRRLIGDAVRLWKRPDVPEEEYRSKRARFDGRLQELLATPAQEVQVRRLHKRLRRHCKELFTFLDHDGVPFDNNHAERAIRPAVIIRKNSYANRSERGADAQAVLMSIYRTLHQRGFAPLATIVSALKTYTLTGQLPPLPQKPAASG
ncbi:IS66 family transposase [Planctomicrobium piriforme]|uniref:Zinc-finger binding domain of transposase IS66 n=1 Tax=Planctomicrobium piriforme TaxID=1576369 RepID=A0A1I3TKL0_9PLAN|nr:IS66 family transposase [Planctomicrobium piriforme]SFJ71764.1 zinc-finger binding domain of transposase IS66 [Planctomicrobium piriforme]